MEDLKRVQSEIAALEIKKQQIHGEIGQYGKDLEALHEKIVEAESAQINIDALKKEIADLSSVKVDLLSSQRELSETQELKAKTLLQVEEYSKTITGIDEKKKELEVKTNELAAIEAQIVVANSTLSTVETDIESSRKVLAENETKGADQESAFAQKAGAFETSYTNEMNERKQVLEDVEKNITQRLIEQNTIDLANKESKSQLVENQAKVQAVIDELNQLDATYAEKKAQKEIEVSSMDKDLSDREEALNKREGDITLKDAGLDQKRRVLEIVKMRLEKEKGSSINIEI